MANPITSIKRMEISEEDIKESNLTEVLDTISENKEAILKGIDILTTINESGALDIVSALVKQKDEAIKNVVQQANKPTYATILENLSDLFLLAEDFPVGELNHFIGKINQGLTDASTIDPDQKTSYMDLIKMLKDPEINRSVTMLLGFLRGMGRE